MYFGASVAATAASAVAVFRSPAGHKLFNFCARHPLMVNSNVNDILSASKKSVHTLKIFVLLFRFYICLTYQI